MSENKYARAMKEASAHVERQQPEPAAPPPATVEAPRAPQPTRAKGRPPGKRSSPDWEQTTIYLRKDTKSAALLRLMQEKADQDLSEIVDQLLAKWAR